MTSTIEDEKRKKKRSLDGRPRRAKFLSAGDCYLLRRRSESLGKESNPRAPQVSSPDRG